MLLYFFHIFPMQIIIETGSSNVEF